MPEQLSSENVKGPDSALPGNVKISSGPAPAPVGPPAAAVSSEVVASSNIPTPTPYASPAASSAAMRHSSSSLATVASLSSATSLSSGSPSISTPSQVPSPSRATQLNANVQVLSSPVPTSAPSPSSPGEGNPENLPTAYTTLITTGRSPIDLVVLEELVTVTEGVASVETPAPQHKRHVHRHKRQGAVHRHGQ